MLLRIGLALTLCFGGACAVGPERLPEFALERTPRSWEGFDLPETVLFDSQRGAAYVSNMVGNPTAHDHNGRISRIDLISGEVEHNWIHSRGEQATLHGPKGMAIIGDHLAVVDVDTLRFYRLPTGTPLASIPLADAGAVSLNDIAWDGAETVYLSDTKLVFDDEGNSHESGEPSGVFRVDLRSGQVTGFLSDPRLAVPNGLAYGRPGELFVAPFASTEVWLIDTQKFELSERVGIGPGKWDGIEYGIDGVVLASSLASGEVLAFRELLDLADIEDFFGEDLNVDEFEMMESGAWPPPRVVADGLALPGNFAWSYGDKFILVPEIAAGRVLRIPLND